LLLALIGCGPAAPPGQAPGEAAGAAQPPEPRTTITVAALNSIKGFGPWNLGTTGGGAASLGEIHSNGLVTNDFHGGIEARLAARLPSFADGTMAVLPDGRLRATWHLRPNVRWHDGVPFTSADVVAGWLIASHPEIPVPASTATAQIAEIEAPEPLVAVITWKTTFYLSLALGVTDLWPLPAHLLAEPFQADKEAFLNHPYWTTAYVHVGAFRVVDFGLGETVVLERFEDYFLGRPKVSRIVIRIIPDENTLLTNLKAGAIDIATEATLDADVLADLRDEWRRTDGGIVVQREGNWRIITTQFSPDFVRPPELARDVRVRRGLYLALDRDAIREVLLPGFADTEGNTFLVKNDPRSAIVGKPFARYRYDPARAAQELEQAGWRRNAAGRVLNAAGEAVQIPLRTTAGSEREQSIIAQYWREIGLDVAQETVPGSLISNREYRAKYPGLELTANNNGDSVFRLFDGRLAATAQNRYQGRNRGSYVNPALDRLMDRLYATIDERDQGLILKEMGEIIVEDMPAMPIYFGVSLAAIRKGVRALAEDFAGTTRPGLISRNAHLWERE
jgi:peptide/nickel transport system substrate-binding protein